MRTVVTPLSSHPSAQQCAVVHVTHTGKPENVLFLFPTKSLKRSSAAITVILISAVTDMTHCSISAGEESKASGAQPVDAALSLLDNFKLDSIPAPDSNASSLPT